MYCGSFIDFLINETFRANRNAIIFVGGKSGRGKSYACMKIAELMRKKVSEVGMRVPPFGISNILWDVKDLVKSVKNEMLPDGSLLQKGSVLIIEEAGVIANSREWTSAVNKALHYISQTYRRNNYVTLFNAPDISFVEVGVRKTIHLYLEAQGVKDGYSEWKVRVPYSDPFGRLQFHSFVVLDEADGKNYSLDTIRFELPHDAELLKAYEEKKREFNQQLFGKLQVMIDRFEMKESKDDDKLFNREPTPIPFVKQQETPKIQQFDSAAWLENFKNTPIPDEKTDPEGFKRWLML